jgi:hypothetical protein
MERLSIPPEKAQTEHQVALPDREVREDFQSAERDQSDGEGGSCRALPTAR